MNIKANNHSNHNIKLQAGILYVVATPIGNLKDITFRAVETLTQVDIIACEDTRITCKLLNHYGIKTKVTQYNDHSSEFDRNKIIKMLTAGKNVALVSDAGTPLISDPGYKLVREAISHNIKVTPIPGASSILAALSAANQPTDRFYFLGFMPPEAKALIDTLESVKNFPSTIVCFDSPNRLLKTLQAINEVLGNRKVSIARELTKIHEEVLNDNVVNLISLLGTKTLKGEVVIIIEGAIEELASEKEIITVLQDLLTAQSLKSAVEEVAANFNVSKKMVYGLALKLKIGKGSLA